MVVLVIRINSVFFGASKNCYCAVNLLYLFINGSDVNHMIEKQMFKIKFNIQF